MVRVGKRTLGQTQRDKGSLGQRQLCGGQRGQICKAKIPTCKSGQLQSDTSTATASCASMSSVRRRIRWEVHVMKWQ